MVGPTPFWMNKIFLNKTAVNEKGEVGFNYIACPGPPNPHYATGELVGSECKLLFGNLAYY